MKTAFVVPSNRGERLDRFLAAWTQQTARELSVIVVEDNPSCTFDLKRYNGVVEHFCHADVDAWLGTKSWIVPRHTDCVRSFGIWYASQMEGVDMIVSIDDDCYPIGDDGVESFIDAHWRNLESEYDCYRWHSTILGAKPRGVPYFSRQCKMRTVLSHGLWEGVLDLDAPTRLVADETDVDLLRGYVPFGQYFPMCGMNVAVQKWAAPLLYFGLQGPSYPYDRFGDIWCGLVAKRILDHLRLAVWSGTPFVHHEGASNVWANLAKEAPGYALNEDFWKVIDAAPLSSGNLLDCITEIGSWLELATDPRIGDVKYVRRLGAALMAWRRLFDV